MKRAIVLLACGILGGISGYLIAPFASMGFVRSTEPKLFGAFMFSLVDRSIVCSCESEPPGEAVKKLMSDLSSLEKWQGQNEKSDVLAQEIGLTEVRLSRVERDLSRNAEADRDMKRAQEQLKALGWKDTSEEHLIVLTKGLNSEVKSDDRKSNSVTATR
jgi:hypothetical protein